MGNHGFVYEPKLRAQLFASTLEVKFTCPNTISKSEDVVSNIILSLEKMTHHIAPISPGELNVYRVKKRLVLMAYPIKS